MDFAALLSDAFTLPALATVALLVGLELVLGIDNVLVISIVVSRLPDDQRDRARIIGLFVALLARLVFVAGAFWLVFKSTKTRYTQQPTAMSQPRSVWKAAAPFIHSKSCQGWHKLDLMPCSIWSEKSNAKFGQ